MAGKDEGEKCGGKLFLTRYFSFIHVYVHGGRGIRMAGGPMWQYQHRCNKEFVMNVGKTETL